MKRHSLGRKGRKNRHSSTNKRTSSRYRNSHDISFDEKVSNFINEDVDNFLSLTSPIPKAKKKGRSASNTSKIWQQIKKIEDEESILQKDIVQIDRILSRKSRTPRKKISNPRYPKKNNPQKKKIISKNRISELSKPRRKIPKKPKNIKKQPKKRFSFSLATKSPPKSNIPIGLIQKNKNFRNKTPRRNNRYHTDINEKLSPTEKIDEMLNFHESKYSEITKSQFKDFQREVRKVERILQFIQSNYKPLTDKYEQEFQIIHRSMSRMIRGSSFHGEDNNNNNNEVLISNSPLRHQQQRRVISLDQRERGRATKKLHIQRRGRRSKDKVESIGDDPSSPFSRYPHGGGDIIVEETKTRRRGVFMKSPSSSKKSNKSRAAMGINDLNISQKIQQRVSIGDKLRRYSGIMSGSGNDLELTDDDIKNHIMGLENVNRKNNLLFDAGMLSAFKEKSKEPNIKKKKKRKKGQILQRDRISSNPFFLKSSV